jgi:hypothetical protein
MAASSRNFEPPVQLHALCEDDPTNRRKPLTALPTLVLRPPARSVRVYCHKSGDATLGSKNQLRTGPFGTKPASGGSSHPRGSAATERSRERIVHKVAGTDFWQESWPGVEARARRTEPRA